MGMQSEFCKAVMPALQTGLGAYLYDEDMSSFIVDETIFIVRYYTTEIAQFSDLKRTHIYAAATGKAINKTPAIVLNCEADRRERKLLQSELGYVEYMGFDDLLDEAASKGIAIYEGVRAFAVPRRR